MPRAADGIRCRLQGTVSSQSNKGSPEPVVGNVGSIWQGGRVAIDLPSFAETHLFWFPDFAQSSGFAGVLAVIAAAIAYFAATRNADRGRWWSRAEYALDLTLGKDEATRLVGIEMLRSLRSSDQREQDFIKAAADLILDPNADGDSTDDLIPEYEPAPARSTENSLAPAARFTGWVRRQLNRIRRRTR